PARASRIRGVRLFCGDYCDNSAQLEYPGLQKGTTGMADSNHTDPTERTGLPGPIARAAGYLRRPTVIFWSVIIALLMVVQWPQLKAAYYTITGAEMRADNIPWRTDYNAALDEA